MTLAQSRDALIANLTLKLPKGKRRRFASGAEAFGGRRFVSLNAAGRSLAPREATGLSRVWRLSSDKALAQRLQKALVDHHLGSRAGRVWLNIDHSSFGDFTVCVIASQTGRGRAVPFWFQINKGKTNAAVRPLLAALEELAEQLRANPRLEPVLVGDRWFGSARLMDFCDRAGWSFVFRTKTDKIVETPWAEMPIDDISAYDTEIEYRRRPLRLILSKLRPGMKQPWWLLTNLKASRKKLLERYAKRWEIESTFKDMKHVQTLKGIRLRSKTSLHNLLLFAALAWAWLAPWAAEIPASHPKKLLSWFNRLFERVCQNPAPPRPKPIPP